jgi:hypothetical protein
MVTVVNENSFFGKVSIHTHGGKFVAKRKMVNQSNPTANSKKATKRERQRVVGDGSANFCRVLPKSLK